MRKYLVTYSEAGFTKTISVLPSQAKKITDLLKRKDKSYNEYIQLPDESTVRLDQIKTITLDNVSELQDASKVLSSLERDAISEKELRDGWFRAFCIAHGHGMSKDHPTIKQYAQKYGIDRDIIYPQKCSVCPK